MSKKYSSFQSPKGMHDILPADQPWWERIRKEVKEATEAYNFLRIDTPIVEDASLFKRSIGETTDVVEKEMYAFESRGGDKLALRPEGTAGVVRAYIQNGLAHLGQPLKLYYEGTMFRYERPQAGRYRQHNQVGFEIIGGENDPIYDMQTIIPIYRILEGLKIKNLNIQINSVGCKECRSSYKKKLQNYYKHNLKDVCKDCKRRVNENPLRLLDCKELGCLEIKKKAPSIIDDLCDSCRKHFKGFLEYIEEMGLPYQLNPYLVRGMDYYNRTVFEIYADGFDFALAGGGRYDGLVEMLGGRSTPAVGGGFGAERIVEAMKALNLNMPSKLKPKVFLINIGELAKKKSLNIIDEFIAAGVKVSESLGKNSLSAQLRAADKEGAEQALILGQKEAFKESVIIRDMKSGAQETVPLQKVVAEVKRRI